MSQSPSTSKRSGGFDLSDYVGVDERLTKFYSAHPDGRIEATAAEVVTIDGSTFLAVTARVYRTPDDPQPCVGSAWEPFPGTTPYTRNSEAMNAETSAVGRALALAGIEVRRSIASRNEVVSRMPDHEAPDAGSSDRATAAQIKAMASAMCANGVTERSDRLAFASAIADRPVASSKALTTGEASKVIDALHALADGRITIDVADTGAWTVTEVTP